MSGFTRLDRIRNEMIRNKVEVALIKEKLRKIRLRWFEHVKMSSVNAPVQRCDAINLIHCRRELGRGRGRGRGRERLKMSWNEVIRGDMKCMGLTEDMAQDRKLWRARIRTVVHR